MRKSVDFKFCLFIYLILYMIHFKIKILEGTDDVWFAEASNTSPFIEWITLRYMTWSGRLLPDTMLYLLLDEYLWVWRLLNPLFLVLLAFSIVRVIKKDVTRFELLAVMIVLGYISVNVLNSGFFWITGSMNYLWPISLGLFGMLPFVNSIFNHGYTFSNFKFLLFITSGLLAALSNEQVGLCMSTFAIISIITLIQRKRLENRLIICTFLIILGTCILVLAPGNQARWELEVANWFPGYNELTLKDRIYIGITWLYKQLFIEMRNLIFLLSITIFFSFYKKSIKYSWFFYVFSFFLFIAFASTFLGRIQLYDFDLIKGYRISQSILSFWNMDVGFILAVIPYVFWTIFGLLCSYFIIMATKHKWFIFFCLSATICTMIMMFFSPTIYASETRPLVVGSVIISIVIMNLIHEYHILQNKMIIMILSCVPILTLWELFIRW